MQSAMFAVNVSFYISERANKYKLYVNIKNKTIVIFISDILAVPLYHVADYHKTGPRKVGGVLFTVSQDCVFKSVSKHLLLLDYKE